MEFPILSAPFGLTVLSNLAFLLAILSLVIGTGVLLCAICFPGLAVEEMRYLGRWGFAFLGIGAGILIIGSYALLVGAVALVLGTALLTKRRRIV